MGTQNPHHPRLGELWSRLISGSFGTKQPRLKQAGLDYIGLGVDDQSHKALGLPLHGGEPVINDGHNVFIAFVLLPQLEKFLVPYEN